MWEDKHYRHKIWHERWLFRVLLGFLTFLLVVCALPFFLPVSSATGQQPSTPFANSQFITVDGVELHCRIWEQQTAACKGKVLLIHGLGGSTYSWVQTADALIQDGYWVIAVDLPGFGYSSRQTGLDHSQQQRGRLVWQLLKSAASQIPIDVQNAPWILVGHSMGAGTVAAMALEEPGLTARLVFADGAVLDNAPGFATGLMAFPPAARWMAIILEYGIIREANVRNILATAYAREPTTEQVNAYFMPLKISGTARAFIDIIRTTKNEPVAGLHDLACPIDAIWGENDPVIPLSQAGTLQQLIPALKLRTIAGAGHVPMETNSADFNRALLNILNSPAS
jgi:pimeloyl-ACP methyl ester carboxylesterase